MLGVYSWVNVEAFALRFLVEALCGILGGLTVVAGVKTRNKHPRICEYLIMAAFFLSLYLLISYSVDAVNCFLEYRRLGEDYDGIWAKVLVVAGLINMLAAAVEVVIVVLSTAKAMQGHMQHSDQ